MVNNNMFNIKRRGLMMILSSPSGAGKSTIAKKILKIDNNITMSVSVTTRKKRPGETEGVDYHFISSEEFMIMRNNGDFLEHAKVFDNYYGTPKAAVMSILNNSHDILFDIDWQGTQQLNENCGNDLVRIFILPPSTVELEKRLKSRAQDPIDVVAKRMEKASNEMSHYPEYDWVIVNNDIEESVASVRAILASERLRRQRQSGLGDFVKQLRNGQ